MSALQKAGAIALTVATPLAAATGAAAEERKQLDHCVMEVAGQADSGILVEQRTECFATFSEAMASVGLPYDSPEDLPAPGTDENARFGSGLSAAARSSGPLATHFDASNLTGTSITVTGADCGGGWLNLSTAWANRISSTYNFCSQVVFYDGIDKTGASRSTGANGWSLGTFSDRAESVMYAT